jgi:hypothetical protein
MARPTSISHLPSADENILLEIKIPKFARTMLNPEEVDEETTYNMKPIPKIRATYKVDPKKRLLQHEFSPMEANQDLTRRHLLRTRHMNATTLVGQEVCHSHLIMWCPLL